MSSVEQIYFGKLGYDYGDLAIVKEDLTRYIERPVDYRWYVIKPPINKTGICIECVTEKEAITKLKELKLKEVENCY